jgi:hypothetical protein
LTSVPATLLPTTVAPITRHALVRTLTIHLKEEKSVAETVVVDQVALDTRPSMLITEITILGARERLRREEDRATERVGGEEPKCEKKTRAHETRQKERR